MKMKMTGKLTKMYKQRITVAYQDECLKALASPGKITPVNAVINSCDSFVG
jgi:hypothetical protein